MSTQQHPAQKLIRLPPYHLQDAASSCAVVRNQVDVAHASFRGVLAVLFHRESNCAALISTMRGHVHQGQLFAHSRTLIQWLVLADAVRRLLAVNTTLLHVNASSAACL